MELSIRYPRNPISYGEQIEGYKPCHVTDVGVANVRTSQEEIEHDNLVDL